jgi:hypothetical protein
MDITCTVCGQERDERYAILKEGNYFCSQICSMSYFQSKNTTISMPPVTGMLTNAELRATPIPVSGSFSVTGGLTDTELRSTPVPVSGTLTVNTGLTDTQLRATPIPVSQSPLSVTKVMQTGSLVTTAVTANQVILTYTVTTGKTLYLQYLKIDTRLTTFAATATNFGFASLESPAGTKLITQMQSGAGITLHPPYTFDNIPIPSGTVIRVVCTPAATTSYTWQVNFGGYEI